MSDRILLLMVMGTLIFSIGFGLCVPGATPAQAIFASIIFGAFWGIALAITENKN